METNSIKDTMQTVATNADVTIAKYVNTNLPQVAKGLASITEDSLNSEVEQAFSAAKSAKGVSRLAKQLAALLVGFIACGFRVRIDQATGEANEEDMAKIRATLTKANRATLLDRVQAMVACYQLIGKLFGCGLKGSGILRDTRAFFRETLFTDFKMKANVVQRAIFESMLGITVSDECFAEFVTGYTVIDKDDNETRIPSRMTKYYNMVKFDKKNAGEGNETNHAAKFAFTQEIVKAWEQARTDKLNKRTRAAAAGQSE